MVDILVDTMAQHKLTAAQIKAFGPGKYGDGGGLYLHKRGGSAQWYFRYMLHGRRHEMGLGAVTLKKAREKAAHCRRVLADGKDPIKVRAREAVRELHTLASVTHAAFEARKAQLKGDGKAARWLSPLTLHVLPKLGRTPIEDIDQNDIRNVLAPLWHEKADTARKAMNRLGLVINHAAAMGLNVDVQATTKAKALLGKTRHVVAHTPSLAWQRVPAFYASLEEPTITHLALRFLILTGQRSTPIRFARLDQISGDVWTVPEVNLKATNGDFRVPLSDEALQVIELATPFEREGFLFPNTRKGVISDATMSRYMERRKMSERPHGFRSSLRNWLAEATDAPFEVAETILQHSIGSKVTQAYLRSDFLEQRKVLMERWARHITEQGNILKLVSK